jgi:hypothetical protein
MKSVRELVGDAQGHGVTGACRVADFDEAGSSLGWDREGETRGPAHEYLGGHSVDKYRGGVKADWTEPDTKKLDLAEGKRSGRDYVVDAGLEEGCGGGLARCSGHINSRFAA